MAGQKKDISQHGVSSGNTKSETLQKEPEALQKRNISNTYMYTSFQNPNGEDVQVQQTYQVSEPQQNEKVSQSEGIQLQNILQSISKDIDAQKNQQSVQFFDQSFSNPVNMQDSRGFPQTVYMAQTMAQNMAQNSSASYANLYQNPMYSNTYTQQQKQGSYQFQTPELQSLQFVQPGSESFQGTSKYYPGYPVSQIPLYSSAQSASPFEGFQTFLKDFSEQIQLSLKTSEQRQQVQLQEFQKTLKNQNDRITSFQRQVQNSISADRTSQFAVSSQPANSFVQSQQYSQPGQFIFQRGEMKPPVYNENIAQQGSGTMDNQQKYGVNQAAYSAQSRQRGFQSETQDLGLQEENKKSENYFQNYTEPSFRFSQNRQYEDQQNEGEQALPSNYPPIQRDAVPKYFETRPVLQNSFKNQGSTMDWEYSNQVPVQNEYYVAEPVAHPDFYKASPQSYVQVSDIKPYRQGEDMRFYVQKFENSYLGVVESDAKKIFRLINKLQDVQTVYQFALEHKHYNSFQYFKRVLIQKYAKDEDALAQELEQMSREPSESQVDFLDRMYAKLNVPHLSLDMAFYVGEMYRKLPYHIQKMIKKSQVKTFTKLREQVDLVETHPVYQSLSHVNLQLKKERRVFESPGSQNANQGGHGGQSAGQGSYSAQSTGQGAPQRQQHVQGQGYIQRGNSPQARGNSYQGRGQPGRGRGYNNREHQQPTYIASFEQPEGGATGCQDEQGSGDQEYQAYQVNLTPIPEEEEDLSGQSDLPTYAVTTRFQAKRTRQEQETPMAPEVQESQEGIEEVTAPDRVEGIQRGFSFMDYKRPNVSEIEKQAMQARFSKNVRCLIDRGLFTDERGNIQLTRLKQSFEYPLTIEELEHLMAEGKAGHLPVYFEQIQEDPRVTLKEMCQEVTRSNESQSAVARVYRAGKLKLVDIFINDTRVPATLDTGAVKTLISSSLVEYLELQEYVVLYKKKPLVRGVLGNTSIDRFLRKVPVYFGTECIEMDIPVIRTQEFQVLLGSDLLDGGLRQCSIDFHTKQLSFVSRTTDQKVQLPIHVYEKPSMLAVYSVRCMERDVFLVWPKILNWPVKFDLALIDLPFKHPSTPFRHQRIPYQTYSVKEFEKFGYILQEIMNYDCVILLWVCCKNLNDVLYLLNVWGFQYFNVLLVWCKMYANGEFQLGYGFWSRNNVELLIMSKRGKMGHFRTDRKNISQMFYTLCDVPETRSHSSKPTAAYDLLGEVFNLSQMACVELFARQKENVIQREQFCLYGDEIPNLQYVPKKYCDVTKVAVEQDESVPVLFQSFEEAGSEVQSSDQSDFTKFFENLDMEREHKADPAVAELFEKYFDVFDYHGQVGRAKHHQLVLDLKPGSTISRTKQPFYDRQQLQVLSLTVQDWQRKGLLVDGVAKFVFYPVVVKKRGVSPDQPVEKHYRICYNFQPLNEILMRRPFQQNEVEQIVAAAHGKRSIIVIDLAMAHQQIGVPEHQWELMGLWTPLGVKLSTVSQFGVLSIAEKFSEALDGSIGHLKPHVWAYADDITILGENKQHALQLFEQVLINLREGGFVLSHKKGKFFKSELSILGQIVGHDKVRVDPERVLALQQVPLPRNKKDLQKFIGLLTYLRKFIPNLSTFLQPLYKAVHQEVFVLSELQQQIFNQLKTIVQGNDVLQLPDLNKPFYVSVSYSVLGYGACLMQEDGDKLRPIAYRSKVLEASDVAKPQYYLKLKALVQAMKDWRKWVIQQKVVVITDNKTLHQAFHFKGENRVMNALQVHLFDLDIEIRVKPETFKPLRFSQVLCTQVESASVQALDELLTESERGQGTQVRQIRESHEEQFDFQYHKFDLTAFFDGACTRKLRFRTVGAYSWVLVDNSGVEIMSESGEVVSQDPVTNNVCENFAILCFLRYLSKAELSFNRLRIIGDSELTIKQLKGQYRVNNNAIRTMQRESKDILKSFKGKVHLQHVLRKFNQLADSIAQSKIKELLGAYSKGQAQIQALTVVESDPIEGIICQVCGGKTGEEQMLICDNCGYGQHRDCLGDETRFSQEYYFCKNCEVQLFLVERGVGQDITQNIDFIEYLQDPERLEQKVPGSHDQFALLSKLYVYHSDSLYYRTAQGLKRVPHKSERVTLIAQIHSNLGHPSILTTTRAVMQDLYWPSLTSQVNDFVKKCALCQARKSSYLPMSNVYPTTKGMTVWQYVSVDLIEIRKQTDGPEKYILSAICNFSKACELVPLQNKESATVTQAFSDQVLYRYGSPLVVRTDSGGEFLAEFSELMCKCHILHVKSSPRYPQSNGLVERLNGTIKSKLQTLYNDVTYSEQWVNLVQIVAFSIRVSVSRSTHFSPYQIMYGRDCRLPGVSPMLPYDTFTPPTEDQVAVYVDKLLKFHRIVEPQVRQNLRLMDSEIRESMEAKAVKRMTDLPFSQPIFVKSADSTKLNLGVEGVCYFVRYVDPKRRDVIVYYNPKSSQFLKANISNVKICEM